MFKKLYIILLSAFFASEFQGQNWLPMGLDQDAKCFFVDSVENVLYAGGYINSFGTYTTSNGFAKWNGTNWDTLPNKLSGAVNSICRYKNKLYVTGSFYNAPYNCPRKTLMAWDFTLNKWVTVARGLRNGGSESGSASMTVINNDLYFYGAFDSIENLKVFSIVKYDGITWTTLNFPVAGENIRGLAFFKNELFAFGQFTNLNGDPNMDFVVKYNGSNWVSVGADFNNATSIESMVVYKNELYVGGSFLKSNGCPGNHITKFDGTTWQDVNGGFTYLNLPPAIGRNLTVFNNALYIGGSFDRMGTMPAKGLIRYDGIKFCAMDNTLFKYNGGPLAVYKNKVYLGCSWFASGVSQDTVWFMAQQNKFTVDTCQTFAVGLKENFINREIKIYPNPSSNYLQIETVQNEFENSEVEIINCIGQIVLKTNYSNEIDITKLGQGYFTLQIITINKRKFRTKFLKD